MARRKTDGGITGVESREKTIRISFTWRGQFHRETLKLFPTPANLKRAARLRAEIENQIAAGTFDLAEFFPESRHAKQSREERLTFGTYASRWLLSLEHLATGSKKKYRQWLEPWLAELSDIPVEEIKYSRLVALVGEFEYPSARARNNGLIPLRGVLEMAVEDGVLGVNPASRIKNAAVQKEPPDPFTIEEVSLILGRMREQYHEQVANYFQWAFFTGMRPEEIIAIRWADIDFRHELARVSKARANGEEKPTKTYQVRDVEINSMAMESLMRQKAHSFLADNHIFLNPVTGDPWASEGKAQRIRYWQPTLKALGLRGRTQYQCRHTFATMNIMAGASPAWVSRQLGHKSMQMLMETYFKWIDLADQRRERNKLDAVLREAGITQKLPTNSKKRRK